MSIGRRTLSYTRLSAHTLYGYTTLERVHKLDGLDLAVLHVLEPLRDRVKPARTVLDRVRLELPVAQLRQRQPRERN
jgi:hypothetical protein